RQDHGRGAADSQPSTLSASELRNFIKRGVVLAQYVARTAQKLFTSFSQNHVSRRADKDLGPDLVLQLPNLHAYRCLRHMNSQGPGRECSRLSNSHESP